MTGIVKDTALRDAQRSVVHARSVHHDAVVADNRAEAAHDETRAARSDAETALSRLEWARDGIARSQAHAKIIADAARAIAADSDVVKARAKRARGAAAEARQRAEGILQRASAAVTALHKLRRGHQVNP